MQPDTADEFRGEVNIWPVREAELEYVARSVLENAFRKMPFGNALI